MKKALISVVAILGMSTVAWAQTPAEILTPQQRMEMMQGVGPAVSGSENYSQLPADAQKFLSTNYGASAVVRVQKEFSNGDFDVKLDNGVEIDFSAKGAVKEIDGNRKALDVKVVKNILPANVMRAIASTTSGNDIEKIDVERNGVFEIEFAKSQQLRVKELKVDSTGKILKTEKR